MNSWTESLFSQARPLTVAELASGFMAPITDQALIAVSGDDAAKFLHSQLTNDVEHLVPGTVRLAGYCSPKGRLQASFLMWRDEQAVFLQLPRELQPPLQKRLAMFVMRAKAVLKDASSEPQHQVVLGMGGASAPAALEALFGALPALPYTMLEHALGMLRGVGPGKLAGAVGAVGARQQRHLAFVGDSCRRAANYAQDPGSVCAANDQL
jgi:hypothetical protein